MTAPALPVRRVEDYLTALATWVEEPSAAVVLWAPTRRPMWIGPVIGAGAACPDCLRRRLLSNAPEPGREWGPWLAPEAESSALTAAAADLAASQPVLDDYLDAVASRPSEARRLWTVYPNQVFRHWVPADASCPRCGDISWRADTLARPPVWDSSPKQGGHRVRNVADSWQLLRRHVSPITGVVTRLSGGSEGRLAGWGARHPGIARPGAAGQPPPPMRTGGKGVDADAARVAAVSEAVERTALGWPADVPVVRASLAELGERTLDPREILLFSTQQYERQAREPSEAATLAGTDAVIRHRVPLPLTVDDPLEWVSAFPLSGFATTGEPSGVGGDRLVPAALVWFGHRAEGPDPTHDSDRIVADSNGVAAGATATEAAVYALLEVIERDAVAMWWHLRLARSQLDLDSCDDDYLHNVADHCRTAGRYLWLLDLTNDLGVPVVAAVSPKVDGSEVVFGFGAHLDPVQAARAAAAECAQFLVGFERATGADRHGLFGEPGRRWWGTRTLATDPYLKPTGTAGWPPDRSGPNQLADLSVLCEQLEKAGLFAFAVPLSRPDVPELAVIRVIVPGARPMFPRFAPGRLFEVPHRLGWTSHRLGEADVNPEEIFF